MFQLLLLLVVSVSAYNIDTLNPLTLSGDNTGEYFGYSVAVQKHGQASWVLVGAPRANVSINNGSVGLGWGSVYNCSRVSGYQCNKLVLDDIPEVKLEVKEGQWAGVVIATHPDTYDAVTCAHRYTKRGYLETKLNELGIKGRCWNIPSSGAPVQSLPQLCTDIAGQIPAKSTYTDRCNSGISAAYQQDYIDVGGVGYNQGIGRVMFYDTKTKGIVQSSRAFTGYFGRFYEYLGYAMASCYDKSKAATYVFVGAPRAKVKGKVDYFIYYDINQAAIGSSRLANGVDLGSYFGSSITCGYTKKDTLQVIVGAPMWYDTSKPNDYDRGQVVVYEVHKIINRPSFPRLNIPGEKSGDRFGSVVAVIGDINKDGYDDLAIGAPADHTPNGGLVYIYQGSSTGLSTQPVQKLTPIPVPSVSNGAPLEVYGFGSSINGGTDLDNNNFPDIVVGAYQSDTAYIYRALPIININVNNNVSTTMVDKGEICKGELQVACFSLTFNISYHPQIVIADLKTTFSLLITNTLDVDVYSKRVRFEDKSDKNVTIVNLKYGQTSDISMSIMVYLTAVITDIKRLIKIKTEISVVPSENFENRISLNISQYTYAITQVKIKTACGDATCITDLMLDSSPVYFDKSDGEGPIKNILYSGYNDMIWSNYTITRNSSASLGKPFGSHFLLTMPQSMYVINVRDYDGVRLSICTPYTTREGSYYCSLDNKLDKNITAQFNFSVEFSVAGVQDAKEVIIRMELITEGSDDVYPLNNVLEQNITVRRLARIELRGTSSPSFNIFQIRGEKITINYVDDIGKAQDATFLPVNLGPGYLENMKLIMEVPYAFSNSMDFIYPYAIDSSTMEITCDEQYLNAKAIPSQPNQKRPSKMSDRKKRQITLAEYKDAVSLVVSTPDTTPSSEIAVECSSGTAECVNISCTVKKLSKGVVGIRLTSYIWEQSFEEAVTVSSSIRVWVSKDKDDEQADLATTSITGPIVVPLKIKAVANLVQPVSIWVIIGSITGGLCFLGLVIVVLYKIGFFKRKRPPKAEFYGVVNKGAVVLEVVDDTVQPNVSSDSEDEADGHCAFRNPMYDVDD